MEEDIDVLGAAIYTPIGATFPQYKHLVRVDPNDLSKYMEIDNYTQYGLLIR